MKPIIAMFLLAIVTLGIAVHESIQGDKLYQETSGV